MPDHGGDNLDLEIHRDEQRREDCKAKGNVLAIRGLERGASDLGLVLGKESMEPILGFAQGMVVLTKGRMS